MTREEKFVYNACMGTGCHEHCFLKTLVKDGKVVRTERAILGSPEGDLYGICQKGIEYARFPYLPSRLKHPLKRIGKRGEGKFQEISWNQAMNEIGVKLREIRDKYGSESVVVNTFWCGYPANRSALHTLLAYRFIHTFGATASEMETVDSGCFYATQVDFGSSWRYLNYDSRLLSDARHIIIWGSNPLGATRAAASTRHLLDAKERGAKLVDIGLIYDSTAAKADQFVPVKGGTDAALALAMNHVLIEEELYNHDYVAKYTVAPFLVCEDNGKFLRESDIKAGGDQEKYIFWNKLLSEEQSIAAHVHEFRDSDPDLLAQKVINGISCKTAFLTLREHLAEWTPEHQEALTGVPAATVRELAHEYVANKPSLIWLNLGMRYFNGREAHRAIQLLAALAGGMLSLTGSGSWSVRFNDSSIICPDGPEYAKGARPPCTDLLESFKGPGEPKYRALLNVAGNPVHAAPGRQMWTDAVFPKLDLIIDYEVRITDTALFSDYVLPDMTTFERMELLLQRNWVVLNEPAIEPVCKGKDPADFWHDLAKQVGLERYFDKTTEEWLDLRLRSQDPAIASLDPKLTLERLKKEKMVRLNVPSEPFDPFRSMDFLTPSGRIEFYSEDMIEADEAMAKWVPPLIHTKKRNEYPLQLLVSRHRMFMQTQFTEFPDLRQLAGKEPWMQINPADAVDRGINDNDLVEVLNDRGKLKVIAFFSQAIPPGVVQMWLGYRAGEYLEGAPTMLQAPTGTAETLDDAGRKWLNMVKKRWAPLPGQLPSWNRWPYTINGEWRIAGNWDIIFDNYCEIKKV